MAERMTGRPRLGTWASTFVAERAPDSERYGDSCWFRHHQSGREGDGAVAGWDSRPGAPISDSSVPVPMDMVT